MTYTWINDQAEFDALVDRLAVEPRYALDTEFHRERTYFPKLALRQFASASELALVDPLTLRDITFPGLEISRETGYAIGFFAFWAATAASSLFTWILLRPASRFNRALKGD